MDGESMETRIGGAEHEVTSLRATRQLIEHARREMGRVIAGQSVVALGLLIAELLSFDRCLGRVGG